MEKKAVVDYISQKADFFYDVSDKVWEVPETAFEEYKSMEILCNALETEGFKVERGIAGIETAFSGTFGSGYPVIGILGEFDSLSGISQVSGITEKKVLVDGGNGHGCGHNMLGAGSLAAAVGIKKYLEETGKSGTVIYFGTPGEEGGSGKAFMARAGVFDKLDFALCWHPAYSNEVWAESSLANYQVKYIYKGISAHAAGNPHQGRSALDAVELMNIGVQFLREHVITDARIHYAITNTGGYSPNVVQPYAEVLYLVRAPKTQQVEEIYKRVNKIAQGAALMTETELEIDFVKACSNLVPNNVLEEVLYENLKEVELPKYTAEEMKLAEEMFKAVESGVEGSKKKLSYAATKEEAAALLPKLDDAILDFVFPYKPSEAPMPGSTDVGDVSWVCPTSQVYVATWVNGTPGHSWQIVSQGKTAQAHKGMLYAGQVLACSAIDLIEHPEKIEAAKKELNERLGGHKYVCAIPADVKPRKISG
ncbi:MAG: amidohydrolase [Clostridiales bacterium]|jgi:aminobenzoyl-glutamate utilization protein B|nr:amidohydrolase [Clostridiales bacterium]